MYFPAHVYILVLTGTSNRTIGRLSLALRVPVSLEIIAETRGKPDKNITASQVNATVCTPNGLETRLMTKLD
jgi:hypothetical protein